MNPLALASRADDAGIPQVGEMPRNLRLPQPEDFDEVADTDFPPGHQVEESKPRWVG